MFGGKGKGRYQGKSNGGRGHNQNKKRLLKFDVPGKDGRTTSMSYEAIKDDIVYYFSGKRDEFPDGIDIADSIQKGEYIK